MCLLHCYLIIFYHQLCSICYFLNTNSWQLPWRLKYTFNNHKGAYVYTHKYIIKYGEMKYKIWRKNVSEWWQVTRQMRWHLPSTSTRTTPTAGGKAGDLSTQPLPPLLFFPSNITPFNSIDRPNEWQRINVQSWNCWGGPGGGNPRK